MNTVKLHSYLSQIIPQFYYKDPNQMKLNSVLAHFLVVFIATLFSCSEPTNKTPITVINKLTPSTALEHYLSNGDNTYSWEKIKTYEIEGVKAFDLLLTSQTWHDHVWKHQLTVIVPEEVKFSDALLFITGGSLKKGDPNMQSADNDESIFMAKIAKTNKAITMIIRQTPMQPIFNGRVEDELISLTLHNYTNDGDLTWPLLFPMVKSAVKAMDAGQEFVSKELSITIEKFVISGASKRGWTTWLTGASDPRVKAIAPMVIDVLNLPASLNYHIDAWGDYSPQIQDYVDLEIPQQAETGAGKNIVTMIDPYSYRKTLTMPKLIFIGTNDEYWPVDAIKNYWDSIPGENYIHYVPNAGHNLDNENNDQSLRALSSFFGNTIAGGNYPALDWSLIEKNGGFALSVSATADKLVDAIVWFASSDDRDFRDTNWEGQSLNAAKKETVLWEHPYPEFGFSAFYIDLKYIDSNDNEYTKSTRMFVADSTQIL